MHFQGLKRLHNWFQKLGSLSPGTQFFPISRPKISFSCFLCLVCCRCPSDKRPPWQPALSTWVQPFSFHFAAKSIAFLPLLSSSISSSTTFSTIPELTADGVLIKSSRNRTVSKQCSTCQLSNCWALLQPLCLAREGRMRGERMKKEGMEQTHSERTNWEWENKRMRENQRRKKQKMEGKGWGVHTYTPSSWSQKSAAGEGAGRPQGGGGWAELGWAGLGCAGLGWSRPVGAALGLQPPGYGLQAQSLSPRPGSEVSTADTRPMQSLVKPPVNGQTHCGVGGLKQDQS